MLKVKLIQIFCRREESIYHEIVLNHLLKKKMFESDYNYLENAKVNLKKQVIIRCKKIFHCSIVEENPVLLCSFLWLAEKLASPAQSIRWKVELLVFSRDLVFLFLQVNSRSLFFLTLAIINVKKAGNINTRINVFVVHINFIYLEILNGINECYEKSLKWMDCADAFLHLRSNYFVKSFSYFSFKKIQTQFDRK